MKTVMKKILPFLIIAALVLGTWTAALAENFSGDPVAINKAAESVMMLEIYNSRGRQIGTGSGFVAFNSSTLVTNYHVIEDSGYLYGYTDDGRQYRLGDVLISDKTLDIAIMRIDTASDLAPLPLSDNAGLMRAQGVVAIGSPKGITNTVSTGIISNIYTEDGVRWIQFTAPISPGSSGGALFNEKGEVIGVTSATYNDEEAQNINFAIDIREVTDLYRRYDRSWTAPAAAPSSTPVPTAAPTVMPSYAPAPAPSYAPMPSSAPASAGDLTGVWQPDRDSLLRLMVFSGAARDEKEAASLAGDSASGTLAFGQDGSLSLSVSAAGCKIGSSWNWSYERANLIRVGTVDSTRFFSVTLSGDTLRLTSLDMDLRFTRGRAEVAQADSSDPLLGKWYLTREGIILLLTDEEEGIDEQTAGLLAGLASVSFEFLQDGRLIYIFTAMGESDSETWSWSYTGSDGVCITFEDDTPGFFRYAVSGDSLTLTDGTDSLAFTRDVSDSPAASSTPRPAEVAQADSSDPLLGLWYMDMEALLRLAMDVGTDPGIGEDELADYAALCTYTFEFRRDGVLITTLSMLGESEVTEASWEYTGPDTFIYTEPGSEPFEMKFIISGGSLTLDDGNISICLTRNDAPAAAQTDTAGSTGTRWEMDADSLAWMMMAADGADESRFDEYRGASEGRRLYYDLLDDGTMKTVFIHDGKTDSTRGTWAMPDGNTLIVWNEDGSIGFVGTVKDDIIEAGWTRIDRSLTLRKVQE